MTGHFDALTLAENGKVAAVVREGDLLCAEFEADPKGIYRIAHLYRIEAAPLGGAPTLWLDILSIPDPIRANRLMTVTPAQLRGVRVLGEFVARREGQP